MPAMVRKQIYIEQRQDKLLKKMAKKTGSTEAEYIRNAIDRYTEDLHRQEERLAAWSEEKKFIEEWRKTQPEHPAWRWNREELYER